MAQVIASLCPSQMSTSLCPRSGPESVRHGWSAEEGENAGPEGDSIQGPPSVRFFPPRSCLGSSSPRSLRDKDFVCSSLGEEKENRRRCSA